MFSILFAFAERFGEFVISLAVASEFVVCKLFANGERF